jgi:predicted transposase YdaD
MIHEILKESWVYQEAVQEAVKEARQESEQKTLQDGIIHFVELRFPTLLTQEKELLAHTLTIEQLKSIQHKLYQANTLEEATTALQEQG